MDLSNSSIWVKSTEGESGTNLILFLLMAMLIGQLIKHFSNKAKVPWTPILTIFGIIIGLLSKYLGSWGKGIDIASNISPHLFFMIFLPPLIFESSFSIDWHIIKNELWKILILAGPMLLAHSFVVAFLMRYVLQYDGNFTFEAAVMFGGLISATDPVAVVSLLKSLGASRTLSILIEGESLLNDGTAAVMFLWANSLVKGSEFNVGSIFGTFWRLTFGGPAVGILFGILAVIWLKFIVNNPVLETNLTIIIAYLAFYVSEFTELKVSGILALVWLGLYMSRSGKTSISRQSHEPLHYIWGYLSYTCETIVFIFAGVIIAAKVLSDNTIIVWQDYLKLIALFIGLNIIRFGFVFLLLYPFSKMGYGLTWQQGVILSYSGLRGAVSLTLALTVYLDTDISIDIRELVIFHTAGVAFLSLVINGTTIGYLIRKLGLMRMPEVKKRMMKIFIRTYKKEVQDAIEELQAKKNYTNIDWEKLKEIAWADKIRNDIFKNRHIQTEETELIPSSSLITDYKNLDNIDCSAEELYIEAKYRYLSTLKGVYWEYYENGQCTRDSVAVLIESAQRAIDHEEYELNDYGFILTYFNSNSFVKFLFKLKNNWLFKWFVKGYLYNKLCFMYDVTASYVEAHEEWWEWIETILHNEEIVNKIKQEVRKQTKMARSKLLNEFEDHFSEVSKAVQHKRGWYFMIHRMTNFMEEMIKAGNIEFKEAKFFLRHLNRGIRNLELNRLKVNFENVNFDFKTNWEFAKIFTSDQLDNIWSNFREEIYDRGDVIIKKDSIINKIYYISKGIVHEK